MPEGHRVLGRLSVDENLRVAGALLPAAEVAGVLGHVYALFPELAQRKGQQAGTMSGGQQQMLAIGHALMCRPRYVVIDEMSLGLAPLIVQRLVGTLRQLMAEGVGILLVEQFTEIALSVATQAVVMRRGRVAFAGPAAELRMPSPGTGSSPPHALASSASRSSPSAAAAQPGSVLRRRSALVLSISASSAGRCRRPGVCAETW
ncbi:ATP-binding cassette domain-containing protein [Mangrovicoccus ximenensis]|uniref:ATP-binding cassette domain-containing protein n=1 Tax=Mangrovicoccus ximenensis TaxID=1911570 RepID=UPI00191C618C|nr:ATP-binding cassette domain-containing protein [Mangrovicoccus ximenensis]